MEKVQSQLNINIEGKGIFNQAEAFFADIFKKLPALPDQIRDLLVTLAPYWAILLIVMTAVKVLFGSISVLLSLFSTALSIVSVSGSDTIYSTLLIVQAVVNLVFAVVVSFYLVKSLGGLFNHKANGWQGLFRGKLVGMVAMVIGWVMSLLISIIAIGGNLSSIITLASSIIILPAMLIMFGLSIYLLFQIKDKFV